MTTHPLRHTPALLAVLGALVVSLSAPAAASAASALYFTPCKFSKQEKGLRTGKPTLNLTLAHKHASCATAKKVTKAFHACRAKIEYTCTKKVLTRWRCTGIRQSLNAASGTFFAKFTCTWRGRAVRSSYMQNPAG